MIHQKLKGSCSKSMPNIFPGFSKFFRAVSDPYTIKHDGGSAGTLGLGHARNGVDRGSLNKLSSRRTPKICLNMNFS